MGKYKKSLKLILLLCYAACYIASSYNVFFRVEIMEIILLILYCTWQRVIGPATAGLLIILI